MAALRRWAATKDATALFHEGQEHHLAYGRVASIDEVAACPQLEGWWSDYGLAEGSVRGPGAPFQFGNALAARDPLRTCWCRYGTPAGGDRLDGLMAPRLPLTGLRVLDLTHIVSGPFGTRILADLGADVVKVHTASQQPERGGRCTGIRHLEPKQACARARLQHTRRA